MDEKKKEAPKKKKKADALIRRRERAEDYQTDSSSYKDSIDAA